MPTGQEPKPDKTLEKELKKLPEISTEDAMRALQTKAKVEANAKCATCRKELDEVLTKHNCVLIPVTQIVGKDIVAFVNVGLKPTSPDAK